MVVTKSIAPEKNLYFLGAKVLEQMQNANESTFEIAELYQKLFREIEIGFAIFLYALDWLFMIGLIKEDLNGQVVKCF